MNQLIMYSRVYILDFIWGIKSGKCLFQFWWVDTRGILPILIEAHILIQVIRLFVIRSVIMLANYAVVKNECVRIAKKTIIF